MNIALDTQDPANGTSWTFRARAYTDWGDLPPTETTWQTTVNKADLMAGPESDAEKAGHVAQIRYCTWFGSMIAAQVPGLCRASVGTAPIPTSLVAGATATVLVPLTPPMPDASYQVTTPVVVGSTTLLGQVIVQGVTAKTATTVSVLIKNTGLINLSAGTVEVVATKLVA